MGLLLAVAVPFPNCPNGLLPHYHKVPVVLIAKVCSLPASICDQWVAVPTCAGTLVSSRVLFPNCPTAFLPQVQSVPLFFKATLNKEPADTFIQSVAVPT